MALSKLKSQAHIQAVRTFTNRENAQEVFSKALDRYLQIQIPKPKSLLQVLAYYGVGGIGKTRLLDHLRSKLNVSQVKVIHLDLEAPHYSSLIDYLLDIRRQLPFRATVFDYALVRVLVLSGRDLSEVKKTWDINGSLVYDLCNTVADYADVVIPSRLLGKVIEKSSDSIKRYLLGYKNAFDRVDKMTESEIITYLPHYLGLAIKEAGDDGQQIVAFIDTFETLFKKNFFKLSKDAPDEWLLELIGSAETGLWVIGSRDYIKWQDHNSEWSAYIEQHTLGALTDVDAEYFLKKIPIDEDEIRQAIITSAKGVPLYLDLSASTYLIRKGLNKSLEAEQFRNHEEQVIKRFLAHLDREQQEMIKLLSIVTAFDRALFASLAKALNVAFPLTLFEDFCRTAYTDLQDAQKGFYSIHPTIRHYLHDELSNDTVKAVNQVLSDELLLSLDEKDYRRCTWLVSEFSEVFTHYAISLNESQSQTYIKACLDTVEMGYWKSLLGSLVPIDQLVNDGLDIRYMVTNLFLAGVCYRKQGELSVALNLYQRVQPYKDYLSKYQSAYMFYMAHTEHLLGKYEQAAMHYQELITQDSQNSNSNSVLFLAQRQYADIQMLRGNFQVALDCFKSLLGQNQDDPLWDIECHRFIGHVYRFNGFFAEAQDMYLVARKEAEKIKAEAMLAKVATNEVEVLCWTEPGRAVSLAQSAIDKNDAVNNLIEVGKCYAALAVAQCLIGNLKEALDAAEKSYEIQTRVGYQSGKLFALVAKALIVISNQDDSSIDHYLNQLEQLSSVLGVYQFLQYLPRKLAKRDFHLSDSIEWLNVKKLDSVLAKSSGVLC